MHDRIDALERGQQRRLVPHVADAELGFAIEPVRGRAVAMDLLDQAVEHPDPMPAARSARAT